VTLDITNSTVFISYDATDPIAAVQGGLQNGFNNGGWNGTPTASAGAIISSTAQSNSRYMVGYADSADHVVPAQPVNTIELKYTLGGDLNLTGTVNFNDFALLVANYGTPEPWDRGAITYGPTVSFADFALLVRNYSMSATGGGHAAPAASHDTTGPAAGLVWTLPPVDAHREAAPQAQPTRPRKHR
jgi:hypothetical protein